MSSKDKKAPNADGNGSSSSSDDDFYDNFDKYKKRRLKSNAKLEPSNRELVPKREPKPPPVKQENRRGRSSSSDSSIDADDGLSALERVKRRAEKFKERREDVARREVDVFEEELDDGPRPLIRILPAVDNEILTDLLRSTKDELEDVFPSTSPGDFAETSRLDLANVTTESFQSIPRRCMIHLRVSKTGKSTVVGCNMSEPFRKLIEEHAPKMGIDASKAILMGKDCRYTPEQTPEGVGLSEENVTEMDLFEEVPDPESGFLPLKVQIRGKRPFVAKVLPPWWWGCMRSLQDQRFAVLKESICREHALDVNKARMVFDNEQIDENSTPAEMEMEADDCIDVWIDK